MKQWNFYTSNEIKPSGWLKRQLEIQASGLSGNLHKVWPDIRDSSWIGGTSEGWERVPYWLDGFVPMAYLLGDRELISVAKRYVDAIISRQESDGWICPCTKEERGSYDTWAVMIITKALAVYYECSGDERIPAVLYKTLKNYYELLKSGEIKLFQWGKFRWFELFISMTLVYDKYREDWLIDLAGILKEQGVKYEDLTEDWKHPMNSWRLETHIVNLTMMLKYEAVSYELLGEEYTDAAEKLRTLLDKYNGTPVGLFTGDECLSGVSPINGTELCSVVEQMYSYELLFAHTGDTKWAERLEVLAFNALPASISDDMWSHQYVQMSNQIACKRFPGKPVFGTNNNEAHLFGLEPNFGCCTSNMHQGWPKLALSTFMHRTGEVINVVPIPSVLDSNELAVRLDTDYPFNNEFTYTLSAKSDVTFSVRIPSFAKNLTVDGEKSSESTVSIKLTAGESRTLRISYEAAPYIEKRPYGLNTAKCGSLVFSLPIGYDTKMYEYEKNGIERKFPYCDYEYLPTSDWSFAFASDELSLEKREVSDIPFSSVAPAVVLKAKIAPIEWGLEDGYDSVCAKIPKSTAQAGDIREISLYPYGCAKLRVTELPFVK